MLKTTVRSAALLILTSAGNAALGSETGTIQADPDTAFLQFVDATRFLANYKEMAAVSARVFGARAQGSDSQYAAFMAKVAVADLSDMRGCMGRAYASGSMTSSDAVNLVQIFTSPVGKKVIDISKTMVIDSLEKGTPAPADWSSITPAERAEVVSIYQNPAFQRYGAHVSTPAFQLAIKTCLKSSKVARENGLEL
ncbi:hypothetical protein F2P45_10910 [Massilia sp. CCM 8733]|uniref:Uncharacterized protein n=1 Tax=Massilia mucilaginosa TaxID=2609282 RepID=A0ABX0NS45_9BURK|nr:hypothetical protein [Massilia mucilaginosa]NHZ89520.1 hypothetical protein [Massilia mucilaginosa]